MQLQAVTGALEQIVCYDKTGYSPLELAGQRIGCVNDIWRERLLTQEAAIFREENGVLKALDDEPDFTARSATLAAAALRWRDAGWLNGWRDEQFTAYFTDGTPAFAMERAAFRPLGLTSRAVHLNGLQRMADGEIRMWVGRRSPFKDVAPNRLDNLMGGGIVAGESIQIALERGGWEEAGIPPTRLELLPQTALLLAERPVPRGLHREWLYVFDLWLKEGEIPQNQDGEVAEHVLMPLAEVEQHLVNGQFMSDAALTAIDCMARLGYWGDDTALHALLAGVRGVPGTDTAGR